MEETTLGVPAQSKLNVYRHHQVAAATPPELILFIYDVAVTACLKQDQQKTRSAFIALIDALDFEHQEMAMALLSLYRYCLELVGKRQFEAARPIVEGLREAWAQGMAANGAIYPRVRRGE